METMTGAGRPEDAADRARMRDVTPEGPEIQREVLMVKGAVDSVIKAFHELREQLQPVAKPEADSPLTSPHEAPPTTYTPMGMELRDIWQDLSKLEYRIHACRNTIAL